MHLATITRAADKSEPIHLGDVERESLEAVAEAEYRPLVSSSTTIKQIRSDF